LLLPVWGARYVDLFLNCSLPTLLAPGNVPALAAQLPCRFVVMIRAADVARFSEHAAWTRLQSICPVEFRFIDDLVTAGNHSTTLTLSYQREVEAAGEAICNICFFFLVADYVVADGSLAAVLERMKDGASGVQATSLQCVPAILDGLFGESMRHDSCVDNDAMGPGRRVVGPHETAELCDAPARDGQAAPLSTASVFPPRELVARALKALHPTVMANMVDFSAVHNRHTNRLFWRPDPNTLIGRFYLMHMICIRPETGNFVIGASCDYSFIPEMCPSGNVDVIADSDEYFVVEAQPVDHEEELLSAGPLLPHGLAASLDEWATAQHRQNARHTMVYHAADIPSSTAATVSRADAFVAKVNALLRPMPAPHRDHPYWRQGIAAHRLATGRELSRADCEALDGMRAKEYHGSAGKRMMGLRTALIGRPLDYRPWHPRWLDYAAPLRRLRSMIDPPKRLLVIAHEPEEFAKWSLQFGAPTLSLPFEYMMGRDDTFRRINAEKFDAALVVLGEDDLEMLETLPSRLTVVMKSGSPILVVVVNSRRKRLRRFNDSVARHICRLTHPQLSWVTVRYVGSSALRAGIQHAMENVGLRAVRHPYSQALVAAVAGPPLALLSLMLNLRHDGKWRSEVPRRCSSVFVELCVEPRTPAVQASSTEQLIDS
jgi:hypothetical protein